MALIDVGSPAINRGAYVNSGYTYILKENLANEDGKITDVELYTRGALSGCIVATFFIVSASTLSARDSHYIGAVPAYSKQTFSDLNIDVKAGDYIGFYFSAGGMESDETGYAGVFYKSGDQTSSSDIHYSSWASDTISLYGIGVTIAPPDPPTNVQATDGVHTDKVVITWTKSDGATGYQVYRDDTPLGWLGDVATYDDTGADAPTITPGTASASDGTSSDYVTLSIAGEVTNNGTTHTYKVRAKNGGESGDSGTNTGYRGVGVLTYQWQRSAGDSNADYSNITGGTTDSYNDTEAPADGSGRYFKCIENASGAAEQTTNADRGYRIPADIDIGSFAEDRGWQFGTSTYIAEDNPANANGTITSIEIWANTNLLNCEVATFYETDTNEFSTRDTHAIGTVISGSKQTFGDLDIIVKIGDYIGIYYTGGEIDAGTLAGKKVWYVSGDYIPCTNQLFAEKAPNYTISLFGTGIFAVGIKWNGVTISKWNGKVISKFNGVG